MLTRYRPFEVTFEPFAGWPDFFGTSVEQAPTSFTPAVDVREEDGEFVLELEAAGVAPEDLEVNVQDGVLTVKGERHDEREREEQGYRLRERRHGTFARSFSLPEGTDPSQVEARLDAGVLEVRMPRGEKKTPPTRLEIPVASERPGWLERTKEVLAKAAKVPLPQGE